MIESFQNWQKTDKIDSQWFITFKIKIKIYTNQNLWQCNAMQWLITFQNWRLQHRRGELVGEATRAIVRKSRTRLDVRPHVQQCRQGFSRTYFSNIFVDFSFKHVRWTKVMGNVHISKLVPRRSEDQIIFFLFGTLCLFQSSFDTCVNYCYSI